MAASPEHMQQAAKAFSRILSENNIEHAFIGGFAVRQLGHDRETKDIDVEVGLTDSQELGAHLSKILRDADDRFVESNLQLFFVPDRNMDIRVPIERLARGALGLPRKLSVIRPGDGSLPVLEPGLLVLTKIKRATNYIGSTRPRSIHKFHSDVLDIIHLLKWLHEREKYIDFDGYDAATPGRLFEAVRNMRNYWIGQNDTAKVELLDAVLSASDKGKCL